MDLGIKILVVDDFSTMRSIINGILREIGFNNIIEADDGNTALKKLREEEVGLILSDWKMPNMNGLELLRIVKSDEYLKNIPFIMVITEGQEENILQAVKAGVDSYITKPFTRGIMEEKIKKVLS